MYFGISLVVVKFRYFAYLCKLLFRGHISFKVVKCIEDFFVRASCCLSDSLRARFGAHIRQEVLRLTVPAEQINLSLQFKFEKTIHVCLHLTTNASELTTLLEASPLQFIVILCVF